MSLNPEEGRAALMVRASEAGRTPGEHAAHEEADKRAALADINIQESLTQLQTSYPEFASQIQDAVINQDPTAMAGIAKQINRASTTVDLEWMQSLAKENDLDGTTHQLIKKFSADALVAPLIRDLSRMWKGGDKKVAWGEIQHMMEAF